jgi:hypothetical protein
VGSKEAGKETRNSKRDSPENDELKKVSILWF